MGENIKCPNCASLDIALYFDSNKNEESEKMICCRCFHIFKSENK